MGMVDFDEPFTALLNQGQVINQGKAMSKSLGNGVDLGEMIDQYGVDAVRLTMVFAGPPEDDIDWADVSPGGSLKFLQRAWRLSGDVTVGRRASTRPRATSALRKVTHRDGRTTPRSWSSAHRFNVMVARVMELVNATRKAIDSGLRSGRPRGARGRRGGRDPAEPGRAVHRRGDVGAAGPRADRGRGRLAGRSTRRCWSRTTVTAIVQVQGKLRARLEVSPSITAADLEAPAMADPRSCAPGGQDRAQGHRARADPGQHRRRLTRSARTSAIVRPCRRSPSSPTPRPPLPAEVAEEHGIVVVPLQVVDRRAGRTTTGSTPRPARRTSPRR